MPDSWVRGFLQVSSAMLLPAQRLQLHPMDVHNICLVLRRRKERVGPRSLRFILRPGQPVRILFEPWGHELVCPRSTHSATSDIDIRVWGRRRLLQLERLVPVAQGFTVHLLGTGMPSFWVAQLPDMEFTLGLSGWTANDWSRNGHFELLQPRHTVDQDSQLRVFAALGERWRATTAELAAATGLSTLTVDAALGGYVQAGRVVYDLAHGVWRLRELSREPLPMDKLRYASPEEEAAAELVQARRIANVKTLARPDGGLTLSGKCKGASGRREYLMSLQLDADQRVASGDLPVLPLHPPPHDQGPVRAHARAALVGQSGSNIDRSGKDHRTHRLIHCFCERSGKALAIRTAYRRPRTQHFPSVTGRLFTVPYGHGDAITVRLPRSSSASPWPYGVEWSPPVPRLFDEIPASFAIFLIHHQQCIGQWRSAMTMQSPASSSSIPDSALTREELYERIRKGSKQEVILEEMQRLGFWPQDAAQPTVEAQLIRRESELQTALSKLGDELREHRGP